ncbi:MAG: hypothetical protein KDA83_06800 [Planctomycetales bacterium]|nr:hypothetical protein [Planctomycetales bacterium]
MPKPVRNVTRFTTCAAAGWLVIGCMALGLNVEFAVHSIAAVATVSASTVEDEPDDLRWIESLEQRRLFRLAGLALDQATRDQSDASRQQRAQVRRIRLEAAWAVETLGDERQTHWDEAHRLARTWIAESNNRRHEVLLKVQDALTWLAEAEVSRDEDAGAATRDARLAEKALTALRAAKQLLEPLEAGIPQWMNERDPRDQAAWDAAQWLALQRNIRFHLARVALERGHWFDEAQRVDRIEAFQSAAGQMEEVARVVALDEPLAWQIILAWARSAREINDLQQTLDVLVPPETRRSDEDWLRWIDQAPPELRGRLVAERIRLEQEAGAAAAAGRWAVRALEGEFGASADLDLAILERLLERYESTEDEAFQNQAVAWAKQIETRHGAYWGRRAQRLLVAGAAAGPVANLDLIMQIADERTLQGRIEEAEAGYTEALALARQGNRADIEKLATIRLAALAQAVGKYEIAAARFTEVVEKSRDAEEQSRMAWLAIWNRVQQLEPLAADDERRAMLEDELLAITTSFLDRWPEAEESGEVRIVSATRHALRGEWLESLEIAKGTAVDSAATERMSTVIDLVTIRLGAQLSNNSDANASSYERLATLCDAWIELAGAWQPPADGPAAGRRLERFVQGLRLVSLLPDPPEIDESTWAPRVGEWAGTALADAADEETGAKIAAWQAESRLAWLVQSVKRGAADSIEPTELEQFSSIAPAALIDAVQKMAQSRAAQGSADARRAIAQVELGLLDQCLGDQRVADVALRVRRDMARIDALLALGETEQAVSQIQKVAAERPDDGRLQRWVAERLVQAGTDHRSAALDQWRRVTSRNAPRTDGWFEGRYWIARLTAEGGDKTRAKQLLEFLKETPPGWDEAPNREALEALYEQVKR